MNKIIKYCVSRWITYILQNDTRTIQYQNTIVYLSFVSGPEDGLKDRNLLHILNIQASEVSAYTKLYFVKLNTTG